MPDVIEDALPEGDADPLSEDPEPTPVAEEQGNDVGDEPAAPISGTPYKSQEELVRGYKEIQRLVSNKDREIQTLTKQVEALLGTIKGRQQTEPAGAPKLPEGDAFWKALAENPIELLRQIARMEHESIFKEKVDPRLGKIDESVTGMQRASLVQEFLRDHPEFTVEDEAEVVDILEANPWLKEKPNGIELAYNQVLAGRYRSGQQRESAATAVAGAKKVAGLGGKKTSIPAQKTNKDPFDEVLEQDQAERELFRMGRKT